MISVDTNIVIRLLTGDDPAQFEKAKVLFEKEDILLTTTVILETEWVLRYAYHFKPLQIAEGFEALFGLGNVYLQEPLAMAAAMEWHKQGLDFADALHLANSKDADTFMTFDKKLVKAASKVSTIPVTEP